MCCFSVAAPAVAVQAESGVANQEPHDLADVQPQGLFLFILFDFLKREIR